MKNTNAFFRFALAVSILSCSLISAVSETSASGSDATVPDIETRIRNSGNTIPEQALPAVSEPLPAAIPVPSIPVAAPELQSAAPVPVTTGQSETPATAPENPEKSEISPLSGSASFGVGLPGALSGSFSFARNGPDFPSTAMDFAYDSADGYARQNSGDGYFDRTASLGTHVSSDHWFVDAAFADRAYGFQGKNANYDDLARRDGSLSVGATSLALFASPFKLSVSADSSVYSSFGEGSRAISAGSSISDATGYYLSPFVAVCFDRGNFSAELSGRFGYETAVDLGELQNGEGGLSLYYGISGLALSGSVGAAGDSEDGAVIPFSLGISWNGRDRASRSSDASGSGLAIGVISLREFNLSGGIDRTRVSAYSLSLLEPFADMNFLSVYAADWNVKGGFTLAPVSPAGSASPFSVAFTSEYRRSLPGHGTLAVTDALDASSLVVVERVERSSFVSGVDAKWQSDSFIASAGYSGEWLDRLDRQVLHTAKCGLDFFDRGKTRRWETGIDASFALDRREVPVLSAKGSVYPVRNFSVALSCDDAISFFTGAERTRNGLYMERSGALTLSAGINF